MKALKMNMLNKLKSYKWKIGIFASIFVIVFIFSSKPASAVIIWLLGTLAQGIVAVLGLILTQVIGVLIKVAQYNNFINEGPVAVGWVIVRDISNMFFVVILLVIAFATILRIEKYNYKKWLPKLLMMAVLINFSKTICGLLIDAAQVIMLTFVTAFAQVGEGSLVDLLGITGWQKMGADEVEVKTWTVAGLYVLSVIYVVIALIVIVAMLAMLVMRMVMIWIYVVLSPLAFLMSAFPDGAKYASQWWSEFTKNLIIGPVLAFFIWLSFTSLVSFSNENPQLVDNIGSSDGNIQLTDMEKEAVPETTQDVMIKFIIGIGMLLGGMTVTQSIGGAAAGVAGKVFNKGKGLALAGAGAVGGAMGYNFAKRRFGDWREKRKKAMQEKSDLIYESVKGGIKGRISGVVRGLKNERNERKANIPLTQKQKDKKAKKEKKLQEKRDRSALLDAYETGNYVDKDGKEYKYDDKTSKYKADDGSFAKDSKGNEVERMDHFEAGYQGAVRDKMTKAKALKNQIKEEKVNKEQKVFESAGSSNADLMRVMNNTGETNAKRMAAAMQLAIREGFKNSDLSAGRKKVAEAKALMTGNGPMLQKFEEQINKRFAALNFQVDLNDENLGKQFRAALESGKVDGYNQDASTYDESMLKSLKEYSGRDFNKNINQTMSRSRAHHDKIKGSALDAKNNDLKKGKPIYDAATDEINEWALLLARSGEVLKGFNNSIDPSKLNFDNNSNQALNKFLPTAKAEHIGNIDANIFDPKKLEEIFNKNNISSTDTERRDIINKINIAIANGVDTNKLANLERSDANPEVVKRIIGAIKKHGDDEKKNSITENNILRTIKAIPAI